MRAHTQSGFTLVELAIAMTVIGLLVAGVMKGQEMLDNAKIARVVRQYQALENGAVTFKESYGQLPGDIRNASEVLQNCSASPCNVVGDESGTIGVTLTNINWGYGAGGNAGIVENRTFFLHMGVAGLISGIDNSGAAGRWGVSFPASPYGGGFQIAYYRLATAGSFQPFTSHIISLGDRPTGETTPDGPASVALMPTRAIAAMDRKIDDGRPWTGDIISGANVDGSGNYIETSKSAVGIPWYKMGI